MNDVTSGRLQIDKPRPHTTVITLGFLLLRAIADRINGWSTQGTALTKRTMWAGLEIGSLQIGSLRAAIEMESQTQLFVRLTTENFEGAACARKDGRPPEFDD